METSSTGHCCNLVSKYPLVICSTSILLEQKNFHHIKPCKEVNSIPLTMSASNSTSSQE